MFTVSLSAAALDMLCLRFVLGQFYDLLNLYSLTGIPSENHCLLMNGDLVDRGSWSIEVILTAFAFKCEYLNYMKGPDTEIT
jgi:hypothetical protein